CTCCWVIRLAASMYLCIFFFQAEDGIRDGHVTGVQTCALPISQLREIGIRGRLQTMERGIFLQRLQGGLKDWPGVQIILHGARRSEERRVGKECRSRGWRDHYRKER